MKELFDALSDFDNQLMKSLDALDEEGRKYAVEIRSLLKKGKVNEARARVRRLSEELMEPLDRLAEGMATLWRVQAEIKVKSGATQ
jgi:gamma-glutamylcyclotransferase (GGCT)/AIG2-like uncharacterized protein YtfP